MKGLIEAILKDFFKPYLVCICDDFLPIERLRDRMMFKCRCGGLMSLKRIVERGGKTI